jgi:hypothetical protein
MDAPFAKEQSMPRLKKDPEPVPHSKRIIIIERRWTDEGLARYRAFAEGTTRTGPETDSFYAAIGGLIFLHYDLFGVVIPPCRTAVEPTTRSEP